MPDQPMPKERTGFETQPGTEELGGGVISRPESGRVVEWSKILDASFRALFSDPTPQRIRNILDEVDRGDYSKLPSLAMEIERKDSQIRSMAFTRRNSLHALEWEIVPNEEAEDEGAAQEAAEYCYEQLGQITAWRDSLKHLIYALTWGVAGVELVWEDSELIDIEPIPHTRFIQALDGRPEFRLQTPTNMADGVAMPWGKFVVWVPEKTIPYPLGLTMVHSAAKLYAWKHFLLADWATFMDFVAIPFLHASKEQGAIEGSTRTGLAEALRNRSVNAFVITDNGIKLESLSGDRSTDPFTSASNYVDNQLAKLYLGQTLTSEVGPTGSFAAAKVHDNVRADVLMGDLVAESDNIEMNILKPMIMMRFPGRDMPCPQWKRKIIEQKNIEAERLQLDQIEKARALKLPLETRWCYEALGIPIPAGIELPDVIFPEPEENNPEENGNDDDDDSQANADNDKVAATIREQVMQAIERSWLSTKDIMQLTKLSEGKVKGVLTDRYLRTKIRKRKQAGKSTEYRRAT